MKRRSPSPLLWLPVGLMALCSLGWVLRPGDWRPAHQRDLVTHTVYAYRQWQSIGIKLEVGDAYTLRASGEWQYSPLVGLHGPSGGRPAVSSYPMPSHLGGTLIGRIGEEGTTFYVGDRLMGYAREAGMLYLRINDDLLGDNEGVMSVTIDITRATATGMP
jgi:hypothetical protein